MRSCNPGVPHSTSLSSDLGPDDGLDPRRFFDRRTAHKGGRKALQLCRQIERALSLALDDCQDDLLRDLLVESVVPAPTSRRLLVTVSAANLGNSQAELIGRLNTATPWIRSEIAAAICRKRVPELTFAIKLESRL